VAAHAYRALILWQHDNVEAALAAARRARQHAQTLDHPFSMGFALSFTAMLYQMLDDPDTCLRYADEALALSRQGSYYAWQAISGAARGWALAQQGIPTDGIAIIEEALATWVKAGARLKNRYLITNLAEAHLLAGDLEAGLHALESGDWPAEEVWWLPEQYRVQARLLRLEPGHEAEAAALLREGHVIANKHGNRAAERRIAADLAPLLSAKEAVESGLA
jgi:tetratricopeptide (TPR) repeat protein